MKKNLVKRTAGLMMAGILFGASAGATMTGFNHYMEAQAGTPADTQTDAGSNAGQVSAVPVSSVTSGTSVSDIVAQAMPSVVAITNKMLVTRDNWLTGTQTYEASGAGSGVIVGKNDTELLIVSNNHVVADAEELSVTFNDGKSVEAAVKGTDSESDIAVVAVRLSDIPAETLNQLSYASIGDSDALKLGDSVIAIGNALGEGQSVTTGIVSMLNKTVEGENGQSGTFIQVDAAINPGNSGGALLDASGRLIGINSAKYAQTEVEGMGFAIPVNKVMSVVSKLSQEETRTAAAPDEQGYLGIQMQNIDARMSQQYGIPQGVYIYKILPGTAAASSDLRERDVITAIDGQSVSTGEELQNKMRFYKEGETVTLTVESLGSGSYTEREVKVVLGKKAESDASQ